MARMTRWLVVMTLAAMAARGWPARPLSGSSLAAPAVQAGAADTSPARGRGALAESVEVTVVNIDVVVRDRSGRQVAGLTRDDFVLFVDGKKVEITNFSGPSGGAPAPAVSPEARAAAPAIAASGASGSAAAVGGDAGAGTAGRQRLNLVVCVDSFNLEPFRRNRVLRQVRAFVRRELRPDDQVMLVSFDPNFHVWHPFRGSATALGPELRQHAQERLVGE